MNLQERLACDRTRMANERTLLAYTRTGLTFFVAGLTFLKFFGSGFTDILGWVFIPVGGLMLIAGMASFRLTRRSYRQSVEESEPEIERHRS